jgi:TolB protein
MKKIAILTFFVLAFTLALIGQKNTIGIFEAHGDVGDPVLKGNTVYDPADQSYLLSAAGKNVWAKQDQFQFAWKKIKGDFIIKATVQFIGKGVEGHRKLGIMARDKLTADSKYIDGTFHGGAPLLTSMQYRQRDGDTTGQLIISPIHPTEIEFERIGNAFTFSAATFGENYKTVTKQMELNEEIYAGLYLCSHNDTVIEQAVFSNVRVIIPPLKDYRPYKDYIGSHLELMDVQTGLRKIIYSDTGSIQCPNWTKDGKSLIYNSAAGLLYNYNLGTGSVDKINSGFAINNNNDHVLSPDGKMIAISNYVGDKRISTIFTLPLTGSNNPTKMSSEDSGHSFLHSWSPDGKKILFTGFRNKQWDIWAIDIATKKETQLTNLATLDDGSEYTPDGKWIYFNSVRTGTMKLWKMKADGSNQEQVTFDEYNDWFPHFSPDSKWIVFISFPKEMDPTTHPFYKKVYIRLMPAAGGAPKNIAYVFGGQGTINVPSWSPDSKRIAFISNTQIK